MSGHDYTFKLPQLHQSPADSMLKNKLQTANAGLKATEKVYKEHRIYVGKEKEKLYEEMENKAHRERGDALKIYQVSSSDG